MTERFSKWDAAEHHRVLEDALLFVRACAEEDPGAGGLIRAALNDVTSSGHMAGVTRETGMSREGLYRALPAGSNPTFATFSTIRTRQRSEVGSDGHS